jgi:hypothetical protein
MPHTIKKVPFLSRIAASFAYIFIRAYLWTLRTTIHRQDETIAFLKNLPSGAVVLVWHDSILLIPLLQTLSHIKRTGIMISNSKDGDIPTEIAKKFSNIEVIRVRHSSRQMALKRAVELLQDSQSVIFTPDGPRGPRHKIKDGCIFAANTAMVPILPIVWVASKQISLRSWDRFRIPLPFTKVHVSYLPSILPQQDRVDPNIKKKLENQMEVEETRLLQLLQKSNKFPVEGVN